MPVQAEPQSLTSETAFLLYTQNGQCSFSAPCQGQGVTLICRAAYLGSALPLFSIRLLLTFPTCLFQHLNMKISKHGEMLNKSYNEYSFSFVQYSIVQWIYLYYIPTHLSNHQVPHFAVLLKINFSFWDNYRFTPCCKKSHREIPCTLYWFSLRNNILQNDNILSLSGYWHG